MPGPSFRTSPSTLARYFFHDCERFLRYSAADAALRKTEGIPERDFDHSPLVRAILDSGYQWEEEVVGRVLQGRVAIAPGSGELHARRFSPTETLTLLHREPAGRFLYQPTLRPPARFYERHGIDPKLVQISDNHPDLIAVVPDGAGRLLRVHDVKRGEALQLTHRVQVLLYALELQAVLEEAGIRDTRVDLDQGAVWLGGQTEPEVFDLADFRPHLEAFLRHDLPRVLRTQAHDARWHLYYRCEWCEYFDHCRDEMRSTDDVSRLVQLTTYGKRHLREEAGVRSLNDLRRFLKQQDADEILGRCASLAGKRPSLEAHVAALQDGKPHLHGASSLALPRGENVALFLTLQHEPLSQSIYLAGLLVNLREDRRAAVLPPALAALLFDADGKSQPWVTLAEKPGDVASVRRDLVTLLFDLLSAVDRYNRGRRERGEQLILQAYVHNEQEKTLLLGCLLDALYEADLAERAMRLLFHFQGPDLLLADQHPGVEVPYPVVVLLQALGQLLALPVDVSYTLPEALEVLGSKYRYQRSDYFHFPLGHGLRAEAIHAAWYRGKADNLEAVRRQARQHLFAVRALLQAVRDHAGPNLFAWPPKFVLPEPGGVRDRHLSRLAFFTRYESLLGCLAVREGRAEARAVQRLLSCVVELRARGADEMDVVGELGMELEESSFPAYLLVSDTEEGRRAQLEFSDYAYRNKPYGGGNSTDLALVGVAELHVEDRTGAARLRVSYSRRFSGEPPTRGERFLLYPRFLDFNSDKVVRFLEELDGTDGGLFLRLLRSPGIPEPLPLPKKIEVSAAASETTLGFTPSQLAGYQAIRGQRVTAVWGPPGTGKTHFLAGAIRALATAHAAAAKPFRVLVTAFTHAAIENVLRKLAADPGPLHVAKAKRWQGGAAPTAVVPEADLGDWLSESQHAVIGATVYSCLKALGDLSGFDLVVIDEASQLRVPEAAVPIHLVSESGRLVLAGDHLQLPPIVAGAYPETPSGEPVLHRSIFEAVNPAGAPSAVRRQLLENFRMNDTLTSFAAGLLYGPGYVPVNEAVATRRLAWQPGRGADPLAVACLDPAHPLVLVVIEGVRAAKENAVEADVVTGLVLALREGLRAADGKPYADDATLFREGVFVVSPHRAQIRAIRRMLAASRRWQAPPFVDTVDKMQGQEADAVLVSYGVADPEFALHEAEFIYGLNRLNVAMTRARCKSVVCLPRPLLEASPQVLDRPEAAVGLAFMRKLVASVEANGEMETFDLGDGASARVLRSVRGPRSP